MALEFPRGVKPQGEGAEGDDVVQASRPAQAQSALAAVEVGSPEVDELSGRGGLALSLDTALPAVRNWAEEHMTEVDRTNELSDGQGGESLAESAPDSAPV
ncbi:hypothetical protein ACIPN8_37420 [Streptomyces sp. NPDC086082]|uniref:hypothetical protein n=1 Tax=Streptomyces sp. NPDC086082 TaxID=3365750 RepID=UPI00381EBC07